MQSEEPFIGGKFLLPQKMKCKFFPARTEHVALYFQHVLDTANSHSAVDSAIYGIQWAYNLAGFPSPTDSPIIQEVGSWKFFFLAFVSFFSIEEVLHIKYGDISFHSGYVAVNLDISKTDQS